MLFDEPTSSTSAQTAVFAFAFSARLAQPTPGCTLAPVHSVRRFARSFRRIPSLTTLLLRYPQCELVPFGSPGKICGRRSWNWVTIANERLEEFQAPRILCPVRYQRVSGNLSIGHWHKCKVAKVGVFCVTLGRSKAFDVTVDCVHGYCEHWSRLIFCCTDVLHPRPLFRGLVAWCHVGKWIRRSGLMCVAQPNLSGHG